MFYSTLYRLNNRTFYDVFDDEVVTVPVDGNPNIINEPKYNNESIVKPIPDFEFMPYEYNDNEKVLESILTLVIGSWLMVLYISLLYSICKKCSLRFFPMYSYQAEDDEEEDSSYDSDDETNDYLNTALDEQLEIITDQQEILQRYVGKVKKLEKKVKRMRKQIKTLKKSKIRMDVIEEFIDNFNFDDYKVDE